MSIFDRMNQVLRANINDMLNHAEDPEKMLNQILRDMEDSLRQGQVQVAEQIAQEKIIQADLATAERNADDWEKKAELAVSKGMDELAREALNRQGDYAAQIEVYQKQLDAQHKAVEKIKNDLAALESKYDEARRNKDMLIARAKRADAQQQMNSVSEKLSSVDYSSDLARMDRRIQEKEARAAASEEMKKDSVDEQFRKLDESDDVEQKLAALKQKLGK